MSVYKRGGVWWVKFQREGQTVRRSSGSSLKRVAQQFERDLKEEHARIRRGGKPRMTFNDMMARFVREHFPNLKPSAARRYEQSIKALRRQFNDQYLDQIDKRALSDFVAARRKKVKTPTIRRDLACLSSAFECAIGWDWCDVNPVRQIKKRTIPDAKPRTRYLKPGEYKRLMKASPDYLAASIRFAVATGLRLEEHLSLTWDQVNIFRREVTLLDTKTGTPRIVPLTDEAIAALNHFPRHFQSKYVFRKKDGSRYKRFTRGLAGAAKRAKIKDLRWHDLRRTCGSWLLQGGVDIFTVSRWLGHRSVAVTERAYAFLDTAQLHEAAQEWAQEWAQGARITRSKGS